VRLGLVVGELVRANNLQAKPEQLQAHIEEMAQSYEKPAEVVRWYLSDRQRMAEVEAVVIENNVTDFVLGQAKVTDKALPFDELMTAIKQRGGLIGPLKNRPSLLAGLFSSIARFFCSDIMGSRTTVTISPEGVP
jgi:hypothetical protein